MNIAWKNDWNTGLSSVDSEHQRLVELLSRLQAEIDGDSQHLQASVIALTTEVMHHLVSHFMNEERLTDGCMPDDLRAEHARAHRRWKRLLLQELGKIQMEIPSSTPEQLAKHAQAFVTAILGFFVQHFNEHDCLLKVYCSDR